MDQMMITVISTSLQISGAILLILKYLPVSTKEAIQKVKSKKIHVNETTIVCPEIFPPDEEIAENLYLNKISIVVIPAGYLIGVFRSNEDIDAWAAFF